MSLGQCDIACGTLFTQASSRGYVAVVRELLRGQENEYNIQRNKKMLRLKNRYGETALKLAITDLGGSFKTSPAVARLLVANGALEEALGTWDRMGHYYFLDFNVRSAVTPTPHDRLRLQAPTHISDVGSPALSSIHARPELSRCETPCLDRWRCISRKIRATHSVR